MREKLLLQMASTSAAARMAKSARNWGSGISASASSADTGANSANEGSTAARSSLAMNSTGFLSVGHNSGSQRR